ncbi:MAG: haloalkane dehalogenase [Chloroflexota bacterium]
MMKKIGFVVIAIVVVLALVVAVLLGRGPSLAEAAPADFLTEMPYETQYVTVNGAQMAYVEAGQGDPILFLHGNPTSKYLWRNIMPHLEDQGLVIAPDLIGMGESDKPDIDYTFDTHSQYLDGFIQALALENITLVIHDWGSGLGFDYAARNEDNVKAIAFMEAAITPAFPPQLENLSAPARLFQRIMSLPGIGNTLLVDRNMMIEQMLPSDVQRGLTEAELNVYRAPFADVESRQVIINWVRSIPRDGEPADTAARVAAYNAWFLDSTLPKLHLYATPGALNPPEIVEAMQAMGLANYEAVFVGEGGHFLQEDQPHKIGERIAGWYKNIDP